MPNSPANPVEDPERPTGGLAMTDEEKAYRDQEKKNRDSDNPEGRIPSGSDDDKEDTALANEHKDLIEAREQEQKEAKKDK